MFIFLYTFSVGCVRDLQSLLVEAFETKLFTLVIFDLSRSASSDGSVSDILHVVENLKDGYIPNTKVFRICW